MAVTKTPRKKPAAVEAPAEEAAPKAPAKAAKGKAPAKKAAPAAEAKVKSARKAKVEAPAESPAPASQPEPEPAPKAAPRRKAASTALPPLAENILAAIQEGRALEFIFADAEAYAPRTFEPRQLAFDALSQAWYVWGWDRRYNAERHHRLDLLAEVNPVEGVGRAAQGPYPEGVAANQIGGWLGGEPIAVKATLLKQWVFAVKQAPPAFPNFKLEESGDGQAVVTFTGTDLRAITRWVLQFGDGIQVAEPARLVDRMRQVAAVWTGRDRQAPLPSRPEPARSESKPAAKHEPAPEPRRQEARPPKVREAEEESPKGKPGKVEIIRFDRL